MEAVINRKTGTGKKGKLLQGNFVGPKLLCAQTCLYWNANKVVELVKRNPANH